MWTAIDNGTNAGKGPFKDSGDTYSFFAPSPFITPTGDIYLLLVNEAALPPSCLTVRKDLCRSSVVDAILAAEQFMNASEEYRDHAIEAGMIDMDGRVLIQPRRVE